MLRFLNTSKLAYNGNIYTEEFSILKILNSHNVFSQETVYIEWNGPDIVDWIFYEVSDDAMIFDNSLEWYALVCHWSQIRIGKIDKG